MSEPIREAAVSLDDEKSPATPPTSIVARAAFYVGSAGLLIATTADSIAVLGRHTGFALLGAIEIVQAAIVFIAASSMVAVTLSRGHAAVHILTDRLTSSRRRAIARVANLLAATAVLLLAAGSFILLYDLWNAHERSELLHLPLRWFRLLMVGALAYVAILFVRHSFQRGDDAVPHDA